MPAGGWKMAQTWSELLFAHWRVPVEVLRPLIPDELTIDTFDGSAWVGVVPFEMSGVRPRRFPALPGLSRFLELNVRTYVHPKGKRRRKPGVWFFSLDAANRIAVAVARRRFHLPYFKADMTIRHAGPKVTYTTHRTHKGAPPAAFEASYTPSGDVQLAKRRTVEHWLTERYALYTIDAYDRLCIGEIHHAPWPLQPAHAEIRVNTMADAAGITLPDEPPLLHYAHRIDVVVWNLTPYEG